VGLRKNIGARLLRNAYVSQAIRERADLSFFKKPPRWRTLFGVGLIALSFLLGWPTVGFFGGLAFYLRKPLVVIVGGPATYGFSWLVWAVGTYFAGPEGVEAMNALSRWAVRRFAETIGGQGTNAFSTETPDSASSNFKPNE
jgi:hypothetical protein